MEGETVRRKSGKLRDWQKLLASPATRNWLSSKPRQEQGEKENDEPQAEPNALAGPLTPSRHRPPDAATHRRLSDSFKERVQQRMSELETSITGMTIPLISPLMEQRTSGSNYENTAQHERDGSRGSSVSAVTRERALYRTASGPQHSSGGSLVDQGPRRTLTPMLLRTQQELAGMQAKLDAAKAEVQRLQVAVAREHEAREVAERGLAEAQQAALPCSAAAELSLQEIAELRRQLTAAAAQAESRRHALLAEKAKAQNALGQLAIAREKVKLAQSRAGQQQQAAQAAAAQLAERNAHCEALQEQLAAAATSDCSRSQVDSQAPSPELEHAEAQLRESQQQCSELRQQMQVLRNQLRCAQQQATGSAHGVANTTAGVIASAQQAAQQAAVQQAAAAQQETRLRQRIEALEKEAAKLKKALRAAETAAARAQTAAAQERQNADEFERQLLNQALEMDDLQAAASAAAKLAEEADELRASEVSSQLRLAEAARQLDTLRRQMATVSDKAAAKAGNATDMAKELKQVQAERQQAQRALDRQETRIKQLTEVLAQRDAELVAARRDAATARKQRSAVENWLDN